MKPRAESTARLFELVRAGQEEARDRLFERYLPLLQRWARGRLPAYARGQLDTDDLVQVTLMRALGRLEQFELRHEGAFLAYLRRILLNRIRNEIRDVGGRPSQVPLDHRLAAVLPGDDGDPARLADYERALEQLTERQQQAIILRLELGLTHQEVAEALGSNSPDAARMTVARAILSLAETMGA